MTDIKMLPLPEPYGYLRDLDGRLQMSIGPVRPDDRAGGYATPWAAMYDPGRVRANVAHATAPLQAEIEALRAKTAVTMGVGAGDGSLFVHGDHESIKAAQAIVLQRDALRAEVERLQAELDKQLRLHSIGTERELKLMTERDAAVKRANQLQEELDNRWAQGVHTCQPDKCQRIACVLRRDNKRLAEALRNILESGSVQPAELFSAAHAALHPTAAQEDSRE